MHAFLSVSQPSIATMRGAILARVSYLTTSDGRRGRTSRLTARTRGFRLSMSCTRAAMHAFLSDSLSKSVKSRGPKLLTRFTHAINHAFLSALSSSTVKLQGAILSRASYLTTGDGRRGVLLRLTARTQGFNNSASCTRAAMHAFLSASPPRSAGMHTSTIHYSLLTLNCIYPLGAFAGSIGLPLLKTISVRRGSFDMASTPASPIVSP